MRHQRLISVVLPFAIILAAVLVIAAAAVLPAGQKTSPSLSPPLDAPEPIAYFPYFDTSPGTQTVFQFVNVGTTPAQVTINYYRPSGTLAGEKTFTLGAQKRASRLASEDVGNGFKGSAMVKSNVPIVAEQTQLRSGYAGYYGNTSIGSKSPGTDWGMLNGHNIPYTTGNYKSTSIHVQNVGTTDANVQITHYFPSMPPVQTNDTVPAGTLKTYHGSESPGYNQYYGSTVASNIPVVCSVAQSASVESGTSSSRVAPMPMNPSQTWFTFGGAPYSGFNTTFQVLNAGSTPANVTFNFVNQ